MRLPTLLTLSVLLLSLSACTTRGDVFDPTVRVLGRGGEELGVSTPYGVVYLGHIVTEPQVRLIPAFGDGPGIETATVQSVSEGLRIAEAQITLPSVPISFVAPAPGSNVLVRGRNGRQLWQESVRVAKLPNTTGLLLESNGTVRGQLERGRIGAGVYRESEHGLQLLGLVDGMVEIGGRSYIAVAGAGHLWRVAAHDRSLDRKRWVYREDAL